MVTDETVSYNVEKEKNAKTKEILKSVYESLADKGYNPINQIVGYLMSGDPGYISSHKEARNKISKFERTKILEVLVRDFLNK